MMRNIDTIALIYDKLLYCDNLFRDVSVDIDIRHCDDCKKEYVEALSNTVDGYKQLVVIINTLNEISYIIRSLTYEMHSRLIDELNDEMVILGDLETDERDMAVYYLASGFSKTEDVVDKLIRWCMSQLQYFRAMEQISHVSSVKRVAFERKHYNVDEELVVYPYV